MTTVLIVNPTSGPNGNSALVPDLANALHSEGIDAQICPTTPEENGQGLAAAAAKGGARLVIVAGGDGTIEAVARGLAHTQTALGIIPQGTRNNIAASLNIPTDTAQAIQVLVEGECGQFDLGKANNHYFMEVVGIGLEATLFPHGDSVKEGIKNDYWAALKSFVKGLKTFLQFQSRRLVLQFDGRRVRLHTLQVNICNSPRYGVEFDLAPQASMNDGKLDLIYLNRPSKWDHFRHFFAAMRSKQLPQNRLHTHQVSAIEVRGYPALEVHADGEYIGPTPVIVEVVPKALWIWVPTPELVATFAEQTRAAERGGLFSFGQRPDPPEPKGPAPNSAPQRPPI
ncbi:diacylglycerol/lipid kinase family protein [Nodosilinea sp. PGN35]|uniref:diacylglycerol/lipid kinase family protein n=1 Tax=Nodosilinea sp. PGN35 TaxID=3020489 RepID=UPI0023B287B4|nr:YegS/Rv2252/BmrU family lipid kinase [Nodosilinea sp. TSF1-S3]MDF0366017.1 YegS/Rv2252/BmrU family lipid kinase [Nodosilinea sp. TSF1-S3]